MKPTFDALAVFVTSALLVGFVVAIGWKAGSCWSAGGVVVLGFPLPVCLDPDAVIR